ncbi:hypothetical protein C7S13_6070 [Burkholderia cepacia]|nr:hypothetical protein [Burkholderia cepacia]
MVDQSHLLTVSVTSRKTDVVEGADCYAFTMVLAAVAR